MYCQTCGHENPEDAMFCKDCVVRLRDASGGESAKPSSKWLLAIPIGSLILGIIGLLTFFDDSGWDMDTAVGVLIVFGIPPIVLGVITIMQKFPGKLMGIIGLILGCVTSIAMVGLMTTM